MQCSVMAPFTQLAVCEASFNSTVYVTFCNFEIGCVRQAGGKAGKDTGKAKAKAVSRSARAGLQVSISSFVQHVNGLTGAMITNS